MIHLGQPKVDKSGDSYKTARRRKNQTNPVSRLMADVSQVWVPPPLDWPTPDHEQISRDCARRAAWYARSTFWRDGVVGRKALRIPEYEAVATQAKNTSSSGIPSDSPLVQGELFA